MKLSYLFIFFLISNISSSQDKFSYYFDSMTVQQISDYKNNFDDEFIFLRNSKDSTYSLTVRIGKIKKEASLIDDKKKWLVRFDIDFDYQQLEDLNKLTNNMLYTNFRPRRRGKVYKNFVEDFKFEKDTINNETIVHLKRFKNKKKKKIIWDHYYFFGKRNNVYDTKKNSIKNYLNAKYNLDLNTFNLEKVYHLEDGKLAIKTEEIKQESIDFNFSFKTDAVFPQIIFR
ncbi:hypothetical protein L1S35_11210 [Flavobacterium sp. AS60]|uniref:hypothetical protein n=1 Tax=Flavobacterium anseongense TaxID=2910677 RepID=UPI001F20FA99|nr:hypothetical protein [Flavobacterium sp. AS60]MCF6130243.1 hypothetical protein [Flavobacterium sp. AS60]